MTEGATDDITAERAEHGAFGDDVVIVGSEMLGDGGPFGPARRIVATRNRRERSHLRRPLCGSSPESVPLHDPIGPVPRVLDTRGESSWS